MYLRLKGATAVYFSWISKKTAVGIKSHKIFQEKTVLVCISDTTKTIVLRN